MNRRKPKETADQALIIVDMQNYYLQSDAPFARYHALRAGDDALDYIQQRVNRIVLPNIGRLLFFFRERGRPVVFLRLCAQKADRSDLHPAFRAVWRDGANIDIPDVYPLASDPLAEVHPAIAPRPSEIVINKTTFSAFTSTRLDEILRELCVHTLVFAGLATSQCVDTTARDAADRGYTVIHIEDGQADYNEMFHNASLFASRGVCGGLLYETDEYLERQTILFPVD